MDTRTTNEETTMTTKTYEEPGYTLTATLDGAKLTLSAKTANGTTSWTCGVRIEEIPAYVLAKLPAGYRGFYVDYPVREGARAMVSEMTELRTEAIRSELATTPVHCDRCHAELDRKTAKSQQEWTRFGGRKIRVTAYYCKTCHSLLSQIGIGEHTDLDALSAEVPGYEPAYKGDE